MQRSVHERPQCRSIRPVSRQDLQALRNRDGKVCEGSGIDIARQAVLILSTLNPLLLVQNRLLKVFEHSL